ncbi:Ig-like domain-containing protein [Shewanella donghaensis]|uniref:Ig-like domain-containing protein n=1 Tax=Shewanella donghaensis TaxID=238836 RepID=UPI0011821237|nr:Ig-like domain-containing protein [Shewanella donghaensis]
MRSAQRLFLALLSSIFLFACSGGGSITDDGDGGTPTPETILVGLSISTQDVDATNGAVLTATVTNSSTGAVDGTLVSFELNNSDLGSFDNATASAVTNADGIATINLYSAEIAGSGSVVASIATGESASVAFSMVGDGGEAGGGAQVSVQLFNAAGESVDTISTLSPGVLVATVTGINKATIVSFSSEIGDLPITSAVTNNEGKASVDIYAGSSLGAGIVTASLSSGEKGETIVVVGATNVEMGSGSPFEKGVAEVSTDSLSAGGTATITVLIQDESGNPFTQPIDVNFSSTCATKSPAQAELSSPVSSSNGIAISTYLAQGCVGEDQINVTANAGGISLSAVATLDILQADIGSIVFVSAQPENIGILGTGGIESSIVKFRVLDKNSNVVANQAVDFSLNTVVGGISIDPVTATTNNEGIVQTVVTTGTVATSVRVTGTIQGSSPVISSQSSQLVISTGIPDQDSFSLSSTVLNAEGWNKDGTEVQVTARMADAFNNPVPDGTTVSFTTEGGSIEDACQTINGACSVTWTSQMPRPEGKSFYDALGNQILSPVQNQKCYKLADKSEDPTCEEDNIVYGNYYGQPYGGRATITATAIGEESFPDLNGNGRFDADEMNEFLTGTDVTGEKFDLDDAFNDYNEDTVFNPQADDALKGLDGGSLEELIDFNVNTVFDKADGLYNGVLCSDPVHDGCADGVNDSKSLFVRRSLVLVMSGSTAVKTLPSEILIVDDGVHNGTSPIVITGKGAATVYFTLSDLHNQQLPAGTKVTFSASAGSVTSTSTITWPSSNHNGGRNFAVSLKGEDEPNSGVFSVTTETPGEVLTEVLAIGINIL